MTDWATHFYEISDAVENNETVRDRALGLVEEEPIHAKAVDGGEREVDFRSILKEFLSGSISFEEAKQRVESELPRHQSPHASDTTHTFNRQWKDRLVRSEASRFYNHAVLLTLDERDEDMCFVPESPHQDFGKKCTKLLAGQKIAVDELLEGLEKAYRNEEWEAFPRIPYRPNCTHTVTPVE